MRTAVFRREHGEMGVCVCAYITHPISAEKQED